MIAKKIIKGLVVTLLLITSLLLTKIPSNTRLETVFIIVAMIGIYFGVSRLMK